MITNNSVLDHSREKLQKHTDSLLLPDEYVNYEEYNEVLKKLLCLRKTLKKQLSEVLTFHKECMEMCREMSKRLEVASSEVLKCAADTTKLIEIGEQPIPATIKNQLQRRSSHAVQEESKMETKTSCTKKKLQDWSERLERCCISPNCLKRPCNSEDCACRDVGEIYAMVNCRLIPCKISQALSIIVFYGRSCKMDNINTEINITKETGYSDCPNCVVMKILLDSTERVRKLQERIIFLHSYGQEPVQFAKRILEELKMQRKEMSAVMSVVREIFLQRFMNDCGSGTDKNRNSEKKRLQDNVCNRRAFFIKRFANKNKEKICTVNSYK